MGENVMKIQKAGCILLNIERKEIGLIYRRKQQDYSFPKGHIENGETREECAVRETEEETGRKCEIIPCIKLPVIQYINPTEQEVETHFYLAIDKGRSEKIFDAELVHDLAWVSIEEVEKTLSYQNLVDFWKQIKCLVIEVIGKGIY